jgi:hypothetical protein
MPLAPTVGRGLVNIGPLISVPAETSTRGCSLLIAAGRFHFRLTLLCEAI